MFFFISSYSGRDVKMQEPASFQVPDQLRQDAESLGLAASNPRILFENDFTERVLRFGTRLCDWPLLDLEGMTKTLEKQMKIDASTVLFVEGDAPPVDRPNANRPAVLKLCPPKKISQKNPAEDKRKVYPSLLSELHHRSEAEALLLLCADQESYHGCDARETQERHEMQQRSLMRVLRDWREFLVHQAPGLRLPRLYNIEQPPSTPNIVRSSHKNSGGKDPFFRPGDIVHAAAAVPTNIAPIQQPSSVPSPLLSHLLMEFETSVVEAQPSLLQQQEEAVVVDQQQTSSTATAWAFETTVPSSCPLPPSPKIAPKTAEIIIPRSINGDGSQFVTNTKTAPEHAFDRKPNEQEEALEAIRKLQLRPMHLSEKEFAALFSHTLDCNGPINEQLIGTHSDTVDNQRESSLLSALALHTEFIENDNIFVTRMRQAVNFSISQLHSDDTPVLFKYRDEDGQRAVDNLQQFSDWLSCEERDLSAGCCCTTSQRYDDTFSSLMMQQTQKEEGAREEEQDGDDDEGETFRDRLANFFLPKDLRQYATQSVRRSLLHFSESAIQARSRVKRSKQKGKPRQNKNLEVQSMEPSKALRVEKDNSPLGVEPIEIEDELEDEEQPAAPHLSHVNNAQLTTPFTGIDTEAFQELDKRAAAKEEEMRLMNEAKRQRGAKKIQFEQLPLKQPQQHVAPLSSGVSSVREKDETSSTSRPTTNTKPHSIIAAAQQAIENRSKLTTTTPPPLPIVPKKKKRLGPPTNNTRRGSTPIIIAPDCSSNSAGSSSSEDDDFTTSTETSSSSDDGHDEESSSQSRSIDHSDGDDDDKVREATTGSDGKKSAPKKKCKVPLWAARAVIPAELETLKTKLLNDETKHLWSSICAAFLVPTKKGAKEK